MDTFEHRIDYLAKAFAAEQIAAEATDIVVRRMYFEIARTYRSLARFTRDRAAAEAPWAQSSLDASLDADQTLSDDRCLANQPASPPTIAVPTMDEPSF